MKAAVIFRLFFIFSISIILTSCPQKDEFPIKGDLLAHVIDENTGLGIEGAVVSLSNDVASYQDSTGVTGQAYFRNMVPGDYDISISHKKYFDHNSRITVKSLELKTLDTIALEEKPVLIFSHDKLEFTIGQDTTYLTVSNIKDISISYTIEPVDDWISVTPIQGSLTDDQAVIVVTIDRSAITSARTIHTGINILPRAKNKDLVKIAIAVHVNRLRDIDSNFYSIVTIKNQETGKVFTWMSENLRVTHSPDGSKSVPSAVVGDTWPSSDTSLLEELGRYYSWLAAMNGRTLRKSQGICPDGWHIPDTIEVKLAFQGMNESDLMPGGITGFEKALDGGYIADDEPPGNNEPGTFGFLLLGGFWLSNKYFDFDLDPDKSGPAWELFDNEYNWGEYVNYIWVPVRCVRNTPLVED